MVIITQYHVDDATNTIQCSSIHPSLMPSSCACPGKKQLVSQAIPFAERGRVWSRCNYQVVAKERNYQPLRLDIKILTSAKHMTQLYSMTTDAICKERGSHWSHQVSVVTKT